MNSQYSSILISKQPTVTIYQMISISFIEKKRRKKNQRIEVHIVYPYQYARLTHSGNHSIGYLVSRLANLNLCKTIVVQCSGCRLHTDFSRAKRCPCNSSTKESKKYSSVTPLPPPAFMMDRSAHWIHLKKIKFENGNDDDAGRNRMDRYSRGMTRHLSN